MIFSKRDSVWIVCILVHNLHKLFQIDVSVAIRIGAEDKFMSCRLFMIVAQAIRYKRINFIHGKLPITIFIQYLEGCVTIFIVGVSEWVQSGGQKLRVVDL